MRKLLNNPWFVAVAALVAIVMVGRSVLFATPGSLSASAVVTETLVPDAEGQDEMHAISLSADEALKALAIPVGSRDPFAARPNAAAGLEALAQPDVVDRVRLSAIWTQGSATLVLVNERICAAGDEIGRVKIESASQEGVWVTHWKGRDFLSLGTEFVLTTPAGRAHAADPVQSAL